jgi:hypothetical protein
MRDFSVQKRKAVMHSPKYNPLNRDELHSSQQNIENIFADHTPYKDFERNVISFNSPRQNDFVNFSYTKNSDEVSATRRCEDGLETIEAAWWMLNECEFESWPADELSEQALGVDLSGRINVTPVISDSKSPISSKLEHSDSKKKFIKGVGCSCNKSKCLRLHCKCFSKLGYCGPNCGCVDCGNVPEFNTERNYVIEQTKKIFPYAFESKIVSSENNYSLNSRGCRCKTGCNKHYCECFKNGVGCSPICKCNSCKNTKLEIAVEEVRTHFEPALRKKDRLLISITDEAEFQTEFDHYSLKTGDLESRLERKKCIVYMREYKKTKIHTGRKSITD